MNLYVVVISDVASGFITGWGFSPKGVSKETHDILVDAVRMSTAACGNQTMFEFVSDNHSAFSSTLSREYLCHAFGKVRRIEAGNSQANPAETQFRLFKNTTLRSFKSFVRTSHNVSIKGRANLDSMSATDYPDYLSAIRQFEQAVEQWNNRRRPNGKTPAEMFENKHPECTPLNSATLRLINGTRTTLSVERMRGFIIPEGVNATCKYEIPDFSNTGIERISRATGHGYDSSVDVVYDSTGADLYSVDGRFIMSCPVTGLAIMSEAEKTTAHRQAQAHHANRKKEQLYTAEKFTDDTQRTLSALEQMDYATVAHFSKQTKEIVNEASEAYQNITFRHKADAERNRRKYEKREDQRQQSIEQEEYEQVYARHMERIKQKIPQSFLNKQ